MLGSTDTGIGSIKTAADVGVGTGGGITSINSADGSVTVTNPTGPAVDLSVPGSLPFGPAPPAIGSTSAGTAASLSHSDHTHPALSVATSAALAALDASTMVSGTDVYMISRGALLKLVQSALTVDNIGIFAAFNKAGWQWHRRRIPNPALQAVTAWHLDPQSVQAAASDDNSGTAAGSPVATAQELAFRTEGARYGATACVVRLYSDMVVGDFGFFNVRSRGNLPTSGAVSPAGFDSAFTIVGVPRNVTAFAGVVANVQTAVLGGLLRWQFTDAGIPASWTASGFLARNLIFQRTNGTAAKWWPVLDQGGASPNALLQISQPTTSTGSAGAGQPLLVNGDTYQILTLPKCHGIEFPSQFAPQSDYQIAFVDNDDALTAIPYQNWIVWSYCNFAGIFNVGQFFNCQFPQSGSLKTSLGASNSIQVISGTFRGTAGTNQIIVGAGCILVLGNEVGAFTTFEKSRLTVDEEGHSSRVDAMFYDVASTTCVNVVGTNSTCDIKHIGGIGNTVKIINITNAGGRVAYDNPPNVGMTTDGTPFQIIGVSQATLPFVELGNLSAIFSRGNVNNPFPQPANAAAVVAMTNAPAGSPAAPVRYFQMSDGAGGFFTIPSLT